MNDSGIENLKGILSCCRRLESLETWCGYGDYYLNETILLDTIVKFSPGTFHELEIHYVDHNRLFRGELEPLLVGWANRASQRSLSLIVNGYDDTFVKVEKESMEAIEKFEELGVIKKFELVDNGSIFTVSNLY